MVHPFNKFDTYRSFWEPENDVFSDDVARKRPRKLKWSKCSDVTRGWKAEFADAPKLWNRSCDWTVELGTAADIRVSAATGGDARIGLSVSTSATKRDGASLSMI